MSQCKLSPARLERFEKIAEEVRHIFKEEGKYLPMNEVCRRLGYPRSTLTSMRFHTDKIALEFGFERPGRKPKASEEESRLHDERIKSDYKRLITERQRPVTLIEFARHRGDICLTAMYRYGWDLSVLHAECGVEYHKNSKMCSKRAAEDCLRELIAQKKRYVVRNELAVHLGISGSLLSVHKLDIEGINREMGYTAKNKAFESLVGDVLKETFPDHVFEKQKWFEGCGTVVNKRGRLRFDFYCEKLNLLVEADGPAHYNERDWRHSSDLIRRDKVKNDFANKAGITLIRIPYTVNYDVNKIKQYLSGNPLKRSVGQPAAKPDDSQEGSTTSRKT